jgi:TRAP-type C4-dicarboxylate transport system substrate-binding protein
MSSRTRMLFAATAVLGLAVTFSTPASSAELVLRFGSINTEGTAPYDQVLAPFAKAVEEESEGRIEVQLKPLGGYGNRR